ncbi:MAG TPA: hypothetical protein PKC55_10545 [Dysgonomonas sp.]|uniref:hypothetical protein n=1 Tax=unclassified Dysgonomonas TaxID=2630389 RepID=UPI0025C2A51A|nr:MULTISPECIES: hypothetical protein [unclassified Dysgonomonas]HML65259.1 hypothetical protein [Dysgonomonas sp.]
MMIVDDIVIFILPVCGFSKEESQNLSLEELNNLWMEAKIIKYRFPGFIEDINDDLLVDNTNNWIVMREEKQKNRNKLKQAV